MVESTDATIAPAPPSPAQSVSYDQYVEVFKNSFMYSNSWGLKIFLQKWEMWFLFHYH